MQTEYAERYITLGLKIAYYRKKARIHAGELCREGGNQFELPCAGRGHGHGSRVSLETLFKMADVLQVTPSKLLEDD